MEGNKDGSLPLPEPAALIQEAKDAVFKLTNAALILGYTNSPEIARAKDAAITGYQAMIFAALEAASASVSPQGEPSPSPKGTP